MYTEKLVGDILKNNCTIINWGLLFLLVWFVSGGMVWLIKYYVFGLTGYISLSNFLMLGTVLGAICGAIGAAFFAQKQIQINKHSLEVELAIRYRDHYINLVKSIRTFVTKLDHESQCELLDLTFAAELTFAEDVRDINDDIREMAKKLFQFKTARDLQDEEIGKQKNNGGFVHEAYNNERDKCHDNFLVAYGFFSGLGKSFNKEAMKLAYQVTLKYKDDYDLFKELTIVYKKYTSCITEVSKK